MRYADDFVMLAKTQDAAQRALEFARSFLKTMGLELHPEKTRVTRFMDGFDFLGFTVNSFGARMSDKSIERFKKKIKDKTTRSHNLDANTIVSLNRIIKGTANYFIKEFSTGYKRFQGLAEMIRRRIRCMKFTRIHRRDNYRLRNKHIDKMGLADIFKIYLSVKG